MISPKDSRFSPKDISLLLRILLPFFFDIFPSGSYLYEFHTLGHLYDYLPIFYVVFLFVLFHILYYGISCLLYSCLIMFKSLFHPRIISSVTFVVRSVLLLVLVIFVFCCLQTYGINTIF